MWLKTGVMMLQIQLWNKLHLNIYLKKQQQKNYYFKCTNISHYYC